MSAPPILSQLESFLSLSNKRETVIASNMANIDTPGYKAQDVNFAQAFSDAMENSGGEPVRVAVHNVSGLVERPDGNNVDLDRESTLLSQTQLGYQIGAQLLKAQFHQLLTAINSGGGGQ